jgi:murein DD-endopeptidase MepM/ murein hydrolase activator NlpD
MASPENNTFVQKWLDKTAALLARPFMAGHLQALEDFINAHLPERQVHLRSHDKVNFYSVSPKRQAYALAIGFAAVCWVGIASASLIFSDTVLQSREDQIADLHLENLQLENELRIMREDVVVRTQALEDRQEFVDGLLNRVMPGDNNPTGPADNQVASPLPHEEGDLAVGGPEEASPTPSPGTDEPKNTTDDLDELSALGARQSETMQRIGSYIELSSDRIIEAIAKTGLDSAAFINASVDIDEGLGGPLILDQPVFSDQIDTDWSVTRLMQNSRQLDALRATISNVPLARPVIDEHYISSRYGGRRDPFKKTWAFHGGIDIAGHWKAPVLATAGGVVTFVGTKGAYGRMIEVDHQNGFRTRYGHLATILVKRGDSVGLTDKIGLMGNSGRSTGTHLHYEIRYRGKPLNPSKFFKAAQHVQTI